VKCRARQWKIPYTEYASVKKLEVDPGLLQGIAQGWASLRGTESQLNAREVETRKIDHVLEESEMVQEPER
jgi:hypothetical protein